MKQLDTTTNRMLTADSQMQIRKSTTQVGKLFSAIKQEFIYLSNR